MKSINCTFYRPEKTNIREFSNIVGKLQYDLHCLQTQPQDEWDVYCYFHRLSEAAQHVNENSSMKFFALADPRSMPSDARVDFIYIPTYVATAFMMKAVLLYSSLLDEDEFLDSDLDFTTETVKNTLKSCMLACTGRGFDGAGVLSLKECIDIFENSGATEFVDKFPEWCPEFTELYKTKRNAVRLGELCPSDQWYSQFK